MPVLNRIADFHDEITEWRRDFHMNPELLYDVHRTAGIVAEKLRAFGCDEVVEGVGRTGVVGVIRGKANGSGKVVGLRADMDALPITEITGAEHASTVPGKMHACGHDGHTAMLLGAAKHLAETRNFDGAVALIFQPAEEGGAGGDAMVKDGMMERFGITEVYGMHNMPDLPVGQFAIRPGGMMAGADEIEINVTGRGGHAAMPHECIDTTLAAAHIVIALQSIVSRNLDPLKQAVVTVATMHTEGSASNVIPQTVKMLGTVRTLDPEVQDQMERLIPQVVENTARAYGAEATATYIRGYPVTVNHAAQTEFAARVAREVAGDDKVESDTPPLMGAEDFSYMLLARPGAFIFVGNGDTAMCHHPAYDFNDAASPFGASYWVRLAETAMPAG